MLRSPTTWQMTRSPQEAPDKDEQVTIAFEKGIPVAVNGMKLDPVSLVELLNEIGGAKCDRPGRSCGEPLRRNQVARLL